MVLWSDICEVGSPTSKRLFFNLWCESMLRIFKEDYLSLEACITSQRERRHYGRLSFHQQSYSTWSTRSIRLYFRGGRLLWGSWLSHHRPLQVFTEPGPNLVPTRSRGKHIPCLQVNRSRRFWCSPVTPVRVQIGVEIHHRSPVRDNFRHTPCLIPGHHPVSRTWVSTFAWSGRFHARANYEAPSYAATRWTKYQPCASRHPGTTIIPWIRGNKTM